MVELGVLELELGVLVLELELGVVALLEVLVSVLLWLAGVVDVVLVLWLAGVVAVDEVSAGISELLRVVRLQPVPMASDVTANSAAAILSFCRFIGSPKVDFLI